MSFFFGNFSDRAKMGFVLAVTVPTVYFSVKKVRALQGAAAKKHELSQNAEQWTSAEVQQWLQAVGISAEARLCFAENDIDGSVLLSLREDHLSGMGVKKLKDRILFRKCIVAITPQEAQRQPASDEEDDDNAADSDSDVAVPPPQPQAAQSRQPSQRQDSKPRQQSKPAASAAEGLIAQVNATCDVLESADFKNAPAEVQRRVADEAQQQLGELPRVLLGLPPAEQAVLLPAAQRLKHAILAVKSSQQKTELQGAATKFVEMLATFERMLTADEFAELPETRRRELIGTITAQLERIEGVARQLPADMGAVLFKNIQHVATLCEQKQSHPQSKQQLPPKQSPQKAQSPPKQRASADFLLQRLKAIFTMLQDPALLQLALPQRAKVLAKLRSDLESIQSDARHLPQEQQTLVANVIEGATAVVSQLDGISEKEAEVAELQAAEDGKESIESVESHGALLGQLTDMLKKTLMTIKSKEFVEASAKQQFEIALALEKQLERHIPLLKRLPASSQQEVIPLFTKMVDLVTSVKQQTSKAQADAAVGDDGDEDASGIDFSQAFVAVTEVLKSTLATIKSSEFAGESTANKHKITTALEQRLEACLPVLEKLPARFQQQLAPLYSKLVELVGSVKQQTAPQQQAPKPQSVASKPQGASAVPANASDQFQSAMGQLRRIFELLNSDKFEQAPISVKSRVSTQLLKQLDDIVGTLDQQPAAERDALLELVQPIARMLRQISELGAAEQQGEVAAAEEQGFQLSQEQVDVVTQNLSEMMQLIKSAEFQRASKEERKSICLQLLGQLKKMQPMISAMRKSDRDNLAPVFVPLSQLLTAIANGGDDTEAEDAENGLNADEAEEQQQGEQDGDEQLSGAAQDIFNRVEQLYNIAQTPNFLDAPAARRSALATSLIQECSKLEDRCHKEEGCEPLLPLLRELKAALSLHVVTQQSPTKSDKPQTDKKASGAETPNATTAILEKLRQLYAIAKSPQFLQAGQEEQRALTEALLRECAKLEQDCRRTPSAQAVLPYVTQLKELLSQIGGGDDDDEAQPEEPVVEPHESQDEIRKALYEAIRTSTEDLQNGKRVTFDELKDLIGLLDDLDAVGIRTDEEIQARQAFHQELEKAIARAKEDVEEQGRELERAPLQTPDDVTAKVRLLAKSFIDAHTTLKSSAQLAPFMQKLEDILSEADARNIDWQHNQQTAKIVGTLMTLLEQQRQRLSLADPRTESDIEIALRNAAEKLEAKGAAVTREDVSSAIDVMEMCQGAEEQLSTEDLMAYKDLQESILKASTALTRSTPASAASSPQKAQESKATAAAAGPSKVEGILRNTLAKLEGKASPTRKDVSDAIDVLEACDGVSSQMNAADLTAFKELQEAILRASSKLTEGQGSEGAQAQEQTPEADASEPSDVAKSMLVQMLNKLRSGRLSDEQLAPMSLFLERFKAMKPQGKLLQAISVIEGLIERQREQNAEDDSDEGIPGGYLNELSLVPRIVERLREKDFVAETTLFEIQCISKILMHLSSSSIVQRNEELKSVVLEAKRMFSEHVTEYNGNAKDPASVTCPLVVTGMSVEDSAEQRTIAFTLFSEEEGEQYTVNDEFVQANLSAEPKLLEPCSEELQSQWDGKSAALLFCIPQYPEGNENTTALSELMVLHDVLDKRFGFDLVSIADANASTESLMRVIEEVVNSNPSRLLVYYHTPRPPCVAPTPHAVTFADGAALTHEKLFEATKNIPRVVCIHDNSRQLEVCGALNGNRSPYFSVSLTDAASAVANTSRCWLYDGVFTPIVVELLSKDHIEVLCPEDLVSYTTAALLGKSPALFGTRTGDAVLSMAFFAPFDDGTDEPIEA